MEYGKQLNPECSLRTAKGIKGTRQKVIVTIPARLIRVSYCWLGFQTWVVMTSLSQER